MATIKYSACRRKLFNLKNLQNFSHEVLTIENQPTIINT